MTTTKEAESQARAQLESIIELVSALNDSGDQEDDDANEAAVTAIHEDALSVEVRSGWASPGAGLEPAEYCILLCTGGPAVRIIGDLDRYSEPQTARLEYQDWGTPWTRYPVSGEEEDALLTYASQFYFGS
mgnify:CR=1 FL=1